ncbi:MAG TPA: cyclic nucleotide-binding domain-containing protein [Acidimicrobiia bacterium]|nr:cyclic nucleotide-binding domain-containing protein [Acidimicrobiia bacterium]
MSPRRRSSRDLLQRRPFAQLSKQELRLLDAMWAGIPVAPGTVLAREGRRCLEFAVVVDGMACVTREGREIALLEPGEHFGEIAIVRAIPNPVTIVASTAMTLEVMDLREFRAAYTAIPVLRDHIDHEIERRIATWLDPLSSLPALGPAPTPPPAHDGDYTLAS